MRKYLFTFENGMIPPAVVIATAVLIGIFAVGILYQLVTSLL